MNLISPAKYVEIANAYANAKNDFTASVQYFFDAVYTIVSTQELAVESDLLSVFWNTYDINLNITNNFTFWLAAVKSINAHVLANSDFQTIDDFLVYYNVSVPQNWVDLSALAGYPITPPEEKIPTMISLVSSGGNISHYGQSILLTVTVSFNIKLSDFITGSITLNDNITVLETVTIPASGITTFNISNLTVGNHSLIATYSGDNIFSGSMSTVLLYTIWPLLPDLSISYPSITPSGPTFSFSPPVGGTAPSGSPQMGEFVNDANGGDVSFAMTINPSVYSYGSSQYGNDTNLWIYSQTTESNGILQLASVESLLSDRLLFKIPSNVPENIYYLLWLENENGIGDPILVNSPELWWAGPNITQPGETISCFGINLQSGGVTPQVFFESQETGAVTQATVTAYNPYKVDFTVPSLPSSQLNTGSGLSVSIIFTDGTYTKISSLNILNGGSGFIVSPTLIFQYLWENSGGGYTEDNIIAPVAFTITGGVVTGNTITNGGVVPISSGYQSSSSKYYAGYYMLINPVLYNIYAYVGGGKYGWTESVEIGLISADYDVLVNNVVNVQSHNNSYPVLPTNDPNTNYNNLNALISNVPAGSTLYFPEASGQYNINCTALNNSYGMFTGSNGGYLSIKGDGYPSGSHNGSFINLTANYMGGTITLSLSSGSITGVNLNQGVATGFPYGTITLGVSNSISSVALNNGSALPFIAPTVSVNGGSGATFKVTTYNGVIQSVSVIGGGSGYTSGDTVSVSGSCTSAASLSFTVSGGGIATVSVISGGIGYFAPAAIVLTSTGSGAKIGVTTSGNTITALAPLSGFAGTNYSSSDKVIVNGAYNSTPIVDIQSTNGYGAAFVVTLTNGVVTGIALQTVTINSIPTTFNGTGYQSSDIVTINDNIQAYLGGSTEALAHVYDLKIRARNVSDLYHPGGGYLVDQNNIGLYFRPIFENLYIDIDGECFNFGGQATPATWNAPYPKIIRNSIIKCLTIGGDFTNQYFVYGNSYYGRNNGEAGVLIIGANGFGYYDNTLQDDNINDPTGFGHGINRLFVCESDAGSYIYLANNSSLYDGPAIDPNPITNPTGQLCIYGVDNNQGECILFEAGANPYIAEVSSATSTILTLTNIYYVTNINTYATPSSVSQPPLPPIGSVVTVAFGTGVGQCRVISATNGSNTVTVSEPFFITPDSTSIINFNGGVINAVFYQNTIMGRTPLVSRSLHSAVAGFQVFAGSVYEVIVDNNNFSYLVEALNITPYNFSPTLVSYLVCKNNVINYVRNPVSLYIPEITMYDQSISNMFGVVIKNNTAANTVVISDDYDNSTCTGINLNSQNNIVGNSVICTNNDIEGLCGLYDSTINNISGYNQLYLANNVFTKVPGYNDQITSGNAYGISSKENSNLLLQDNTYTGFDGTYHLVNNTGKLSIPGKSFSANYNSININDTVTFTIPVFNLGNIAMTQPLSTTTSWLIIPSSINIAAESTVNIYAIANVGNLSAGTYNGSVMIGNYTISLELILSKDLE